MNTHKTYAADFETYYDGDCSIKTLGPRGYFSHPDFDAYMVTIVGDDGYNFVGHPKDFDWTLLNGAQVLSHNASFDESLYLFGVERGWYPACTPLAWDCTADMVAFLGLPRSLKGASAAVFDIEVNKTTRDNMKGKRWGSMTTEFKDEVSEYALDDSKLCLRLWQELSDQWPEQERDISRLNREVCRRGVPIDTCKLQANLNHIKQELFDAENSIPWIGDSTALSRKAFNEECRKGGIIPPVSLAKDNPDTERWFDRHAKEAPWARAVQNYRRINSFIKKLEAFDKGTMSDGRYYGGLMYCGANPTARFSGSGGNLNMQNLPREEMFGVNFRHMIRAKEGTKLIVADLSQIEVRTLCWMAKDTRAMDLIRESDDIYHAFGVLLGLHDPANGPLKKFSPELRHKVKSITLGCGFGMGFQRFAEFSGMSVKEAEEAVMIYRNRMSSVVQLWKSIDRDMAMCHNLGQPFELGLPSGRTLKYGPLRRMRRTGTTQFQYLCKMVRNGQRRDMAIFGGLCSENLAQGLARDIFSDMMLRVDAAGYKVILHVHDEMVCEVDEDIAEGAMQDILRIMSTPPDWIPDIPVMAEAQILDLYSK
jgi:DNA polymerase bacteriophage-type